jgi:hypothetical protein
MAQTFNVSIPRMMNPCTPFTVRRFEATNFGNHAEPEMTPLPNRRPHAVNRHN